jgi:hypothetical protein
MDVKIASSLAAGIFHVRRGDLFAASLHVGGNRQQDLEFI